jgi:nucleoside-diphosphate-sugar epimerase
MHDLMLPISSIADTGHSPYGCSKLAADIYVQDYAHTYGLKTGVFRMSCDHSIQRQGRLKAALLYVLLIFAN